ncbi:hypothetical protein TNCV_4837321 [Trichonephila clavipes]|nr:hypothetical protein TNCV_4837321 [Trichonephila clavipes]
MVRRWRAEGKESGRHHGTCIISVKKWGVLKVYCLDLRNHGESPSCEKCTTFTMFEDVKYFIKVNELQKISFVCHSFSTTTAYLVALKKQNPAPEVDSNGRLPKLTPNNRGYVQGKTVIGDNWNKSGKPYGQIRR